MSATDLSPGSRASRVLLEIDAYTETLDVLMQRGRSSAAYPAAVEHMDRIRLYCSGLPAVSAPWVAVLISHVELMQSLWVPDPNEDVLHDHLAAVRYLRQRCARMVSAPDPSCTSRTSSRAMSATPVFR